MILPLTHYTNKSGNVCIFGGEMLIAYLSVSINTTEAESIAAEICAAVNGHEGLVEACKAAYCNCSIAEAESGHRIGCWMPQMQDALAAVEKGKVQT